MATSGALSGVVATYYQFVIHGMTPPTNALPGNWTQYATAFTAPAGDNDLYGFSVDNAGNVETPVNLGEFKVDSTAPTTSPSPSPAPNAAGWNSGNVTLTLTAVDNAGGSGVQSITYSATGAQTIPPTTVNGATVMVSITPPGVTTVSYTATDLAGNVEATKTTTVRIDATAPSCAVTGVGVNVQGQRYVQVTAQDTGSGIAGITLTTLVNATGSVGAYQTGITSVPTTVSTADDPTGPVLVTATKINQSLGSQLAVQVTDVAGNVTACDPVDLTVDRATGKPIAQTITGLTPSEGKVQVVNGSPGLTNLSLSVNGQNFEVDGLKDGETRYLDVSAALHQGNSNTIVVTPKGKPGGSAWVMVADRPFHSQ